MTIVQQWTHPHRQAEVTEEILEGLMTMYPPDALDTLDALKEPSAYVQAMNRNSMVLPVTLQELNNLQGCTITGLIDSGPQVGLSTNAWWRKEASVYDANRMLNWRGQITHIACLHSTVQDHTEVFPFAITDTLTGKRTS
jgi:hypothetical protein